MNQYKPICDNEAIAIKVLTCVQHLINQSSFDVHIERLDKELCISSRSQEEFDFVSAYVDGAIDVLEDFQ